MAHIEGSNRKSDAVLQTVPLGTQWPTVDPFLFCAHHDDAYPAANGAHAPDVPLAGRELGSDFAGIDGWNMYHGRTVPGFPQHPHRGFETITFVRRGIVDHSDSLGATARFGRGDTQWMTAGGGIVHAEMFPLLSDDEPNPLQLFQIWLNLPASDKLVDPYFTMLWSDSIPKVESIDESGNATSITLITGPTRGMQPPEPPPNSWAAHPDADVAIWHIRMDAQASWTLPAAPRPGTLRTLYFFEGDQIQIDGTTIDANSGVAVDPDANLELRGGTIEAELMMLQGRPIDEPVAQYGPFVMNSQSEIQQAFVDYQETGFGGWPWPSDDPVHLDAPGRFARHADGRTEHRSLD